MSANARDRFTLQLLRPPFAAPEAPEFAENAGDWAEALELARALHGALPFLCALERAPWRERIPAAARMRLELELSRERMRLAILDHDFEEALGALVDARVPVIVVKGMDLGRRVYAERVQRPMRDGDLLVPPSSYEYGLQVLRRCGFERVPETGTDRFRAELQRHPQGGVVELHRALLAGDTEQSLAPLWERSLEGRLPGLPREARVLDDADGFAYLLRHACVQHVLESPIWLNDLHLLALHALRPGAEPFAWSRVTEELSRRDASAAGWFALTLLRDSWRTPVPTDALAELGQRIGPVKRRWLRGLADADRWFLSHPRRLPWVARARVLLRDGALDTFRYGLQRIGL